jgi:hypothetical protein
MQTRQPYSSSGLETRWSKGSSLALWLAIVLALQPVSAFAYLDPTTGSMVISAIVGLLASLVLAIKTYWYRLRRFFKRKPVENETKNDKV